MYNNIPQELRALPQWVCWRQEVINGRQTKVPYSPKGNFKANISNPATWGGFDETVAVARISKMSGIGFVLTANDPYTGIDIDNKPDNPASEIELQTHQKILDAFQSYTEKSVGGSGFHIIVRGTIPSGCDKRHVGIYSSARYLTFTGQVVRDAPIIDCQELLTSLYNEMQSQSAMPVQLIEQESDLTDSELINMAMNASNADKFNSLCAGDMTGYGSQSEADLALLSILAFYSQDNEQCRRIFRMSALGKREKAVRNNVYLDHTLIKIRSNEAPPIDAAQLIANAQAAALPAPENEEGEISYPPISVPPGLVGELAQYFYQTAIRPVPEVALAAAIALMAGVCGRSYNVSGTGLNQYLILVAKTGSGKEGALSGIENLISFIRPQVPMIDQFIGPAAFASGQALIRVLSDNPCFVSVLGEFGITLQQLSDPRANSATVMLRKVMLDLYAKSGWARMLRSSVYSDVEKNTKVVQAPNVTILGECTPETLFDGLDASHIAEGLIPRFSIIEYTGGRPVRNRKANFPPSDVLAQRFMDLATVSITTNNNNTCIQVQMDHASAILLDAFDEKADKIMNASHFDVEVQLWNRAHLKALKMAALLAVGINLHAPTITPDLAQWAIDFVVRDVELVTKRFRSGDVGTGDSKQYNDLKHAIRSYLKATVEQISKSCKITAEMHTLKIIPYQYLCRRTASVSSFRNDRLGATVALKRTIETMILSGELIEIPKQHIERSFGTSATFYGISQSWQ